LLTSLASTFALQQLDAQSLRLGSLLSEARLIATSFDTSIQCTHQRSSMETLTPKAIELAKDGQTEPVNLRVRSYRHYTTTYMFRDAHVVVVPRTAAAPPLKQIKQQQQQMLSSSMPADP
jgi:hypothetical protein